VELDLELTVSFLALMDAENVTRAARLLHITPSTLTKRIQRLEQQLGVDLLERCPTGLAGMTPAGARFAAAARSLVDHAAEVVRIARIEEGRESIRIGVPAGTVEFLDMVKIRDLTQCIRDEYPTTRFTAVNVPFPALRTCLGARKVDLLLTIGQVRAVGSQPIAWGWSTTVIAWPALTESTWWNLPHSR
jgi:DNA-binding transcriptional LysR family regulator